MKVSTVSTRNIRNNAINECLGVVLHYEAGSMAGMVNLMTSPGGRKSVHVLIDRDGTRVEMAADKMVTWHAGASKFRGRVDCNSFMLGVAFLGNQMPSEEQLKSLCEWLKPRVKAYKWKMDDIVDHRSVAVPTGRVRDIPEDQMSQIKKFIHLNLFQK
jgi:N-acetyl-anhydromuramyl-L-alanine amidase AmpD